VGDPGQPWIPHLTLGYPATPAKEIPDEQFGSIYDISFNKLAVWTGDFEGPEFLLKDYGEEFDEMAIPMDVAMSELTHYGKKGMKWGVRNDPKSEGRREGLQRHLDPQGHDLGTDIFKSVVWPLVPPLGVFAIPSDIRLARGAGRTIKSKAVDVQEKRFEKKAQSAKNFAKIHNGSIERSNRELGKINEKYKDVDLTKNPKKQKQYDGEVLKMMQDSYRGSANSITNRANTRHLDVDFQGDGMDVKITAKEGPGTPLPERVKHAAEDDEEVFTFHAKIKRNAIGHIVGFEFEDFEPPSMAQTADLGVEFLEHFGVKGMRWGHRKEQASAGARAAGRGLGKAAAATARFAGDVSFENQAEDGRAREAIINESYKPFRRTDLPAIKARHGDYAKLSNRAKKPFSKEAKAYRKDARETYVKRLESTANSMKNVSGDRQYTIRERGLDLPASGGALPKSKTYWDVSTRRVKHAATDDFTRLEVVMDDEGYITDLKKVEVELAQSVSDVGAAFVLEHYGVKGMRWGQRKPPPQAVGPSARSVVPRGTRRKTKIKVAGGENHPAHDDAVKVAQAKAKMQKSGTAALSNKELQDLQNRLNLERNVKQLVTSTTTAGRGRKFVRGLTGFNKEINEAVGTGLQSERLARQVRR
jgi:hypothetical protein